MTIVATTSGEEASTPKPAEGYNYAEEQRLLGEMRGKNADLHKELSAGNFLADTLEVLRSEIKNARYPAIILDKEKQAHDEAAKLPLSLAEAQAAYVAALPTVPESEPVQPAAFYRETMDRVALDFQEHLPLPVTGTLTMADFDKLSPSSFQAAKIALGKEVGTAIQAVRRNNGVIEDEITRSERDLMEQSSKFWRHLQGRDQEDRNYEWIGMLGLLSMAGAALLGIAILIYLGRHAHLPEQFTEYLRWNPLLDITTVFLLTIAIVILGLNKQLNSEVLGTLIGGISGYVLGRASRASSAAQAQEIREIVRGTPNVENASEGVATVMEELGDNYLLPDQLIRMADNQLTLAEIEKHLDTKKHDRVIIFQPAAANSGSARGVLHLSVLKAYLAKQAKSLSSQQASALTLDDLLKDSDFKPIFDNSAAWVRSSDKLSDAKAAMDSKSRTLGSRGNCYDVLVTPNGLSNENVLGIITNEILQKRARV